jgi:hypothetical protein
MECILENRVLKEVAPQAIEDTGGFMVFLKGDDPRYLERWLANTQQAGIGCEEIPHGRALELEPNLSLDAERVFSVPDADRTRVRSRCSASHRDPGAGALHFGLFPAILRFESSPNRLLRSVFACPEDSAMLRTCRSEASTPLRPGATSSAPGSADPERTFVSESAFRTDARITRNSP